MHLSYRGADTDPLEGADELSMKLIRHYCPGLAWECCDGECVISGRMTSGRMTQPVE